MTDQETIYMMALTRVPRLNLLTRHLLLRELGSATAVYENRKDIRGLLPDASDKMTEALVAMDEHLPRAYEEMEFVEAKQVRCLCYGDIGYPSRLRECDDAPLLLYYRGNADLNASKTVSVVGTRKCTEYGKDMCRYFLSELGRICPGVLVISGLAYGIDINAHRQALAAGLPTVGVLAHGLDQIYPRLHRDTAVEMVSQGGVLTEFMSRTNADKMNFVRRNRIVAGMADATVVVESAEKGGALITASLAGGYHRDVFAFPGRAFDPYSSGCNRLIAENKALLVTGAADFAQAMGWIADEQYVCKDTQLELFPDLDADERMVVQCLRRCDAKQINALVVESDIPVHKLSAVLFGLEMKGVVKLLSGGQYALVR